MSEVKQKKPLYKRWWVWVLAVFVLIGVFGKDEDGQSASAASSGSSAAKSNAPAPVPLPPAQVSLLEAVTSAQAKSRSAENDMQRGGIRAEREKKLCDAMQSLAAKDWIGRVASVGANSEGKGVLEIEIAKDVTIKTWNNAFSDISHRTLIEPGTPLFEAASMLKRGQTVKFSGSFFRGTGGECIAESSLSLQGKVSQPDFIFRFSAVQPG